MRGSLTTIASALASSPRSHSRSSSCTFGAASAICSQAAGRESLSVTRLSFSSARVEVDHPARLAEPARVGVVGLHLGLRDREAELAEDPRQQAGAAAADTDDEDEVLHDSSHNRRTTRSAAPPSSSAQKRARNAAR